MDLWVPIALTANQTWNAVPSTSTCRAPFQGKLGVAKTGGRALYLFGANTFTRAASASLAAGVLYIGSSTTGAPGSVTLGPGGHGRA